MTANPIRRKDVVPDKRKGDVKSSNSVSQQRLATLMTAARKILIRDGFAGLRLREIAAEAGMGYGHLQHFLPTKDDLIDALWQFNANRHFERYDSMFDELPEDPYKKLETVTRHTIRDAASPDSKSFFLELWAAARHSSSAKLSMDRIYSRLYRNVDRIVADLNPELTTVGIRNRSLQIAAIADGLLVQLSDGPEADNSLADDIRQTVMWVATSPSSPTVRSVTSRARHRDPTLELEAGRDLEHNRLADMLHAAHRVLIRDGYAGLRLREIASEAGVSLGHLQHFLPTKDALIDALWEYILSRYSEQYEAMFRDLPPDPRKRLQAVAEYTVRDARSSDSKSVFMDLWAAARHNESARASMDRIYRKHHPLIDQLIGHLNPDLTEAERRNRTMQITILADGLLVNMPEKQTPRMAAALSADIVRTVMWIATAPAHRAAA